MYIVKLKPLLKKYHLCLKIFYNRCIATMAIIIIKRYHRIIIWTFQKRKQHYHVEYSIKTSIFCILSHNRFRISRKSQRNSRAFIYFFAYLYCADAALFFIFFVHKYLLWCICVCVCVCICVWCGAL